MTSTDRLLSVLGHPRRQAIVQYFRDAETNVATVEELSDHFIEAEPDPDPEFQVVAELHHVHLPKLGDSCIAEYDARSSTVRYYPDLLTDDALESVSDSSW